MQISHGKFEGVHEKSCIVWVGNIMTLRVDEWIRTTKSWILDWLGWFMAFSSDSPACDSQTERVEAQGWDLTIYFFLKLAGLKQLRN